MSVYINCRIPLPFRINLQSTTTAPLIYIYYSYSYNTLSNVQLRDTPRPPGHRPRIQQCNLHRCVTAPSICPRLRRLNHEPPTSRSCPVHLRRGIARAVPSVLPPDIAVSRPAHCSRHRLVPGVLRHLEGREDDAEYSAAA